MGKMIAFPANGRTCPGYLAEPATSDARSRGVIVIQEKWGLNVDIKSIADRLAGHGYLALAPDVYHGKQTQSSDEAERLLMALDVVEAEADLRGAIAHLRQDTGHPVGIVGFSMGGALALFAACRNGDSIAACVVYYGRHEKIAYDLDGLRAPLLGHWAGDDAWANEGVPGLSADLQKRGRPFEFHTYPETRHAFFKRDGVNYQRAAAEASWRRTLAFLAQHL